MAILKSNINVRINIYLFIVYAISLIMVVIWAYFHLAGIKNSTLESARKEINTQFQQAMQAKEKAWLSNAIQFANNDALIEAVKTNNRVLAGQILDKYHLLYRQNTDFNNIFIHLLDSNLHSFYKSWDHFNYGEDLSYMAGYRYVKTGLQGIVTLEESSKGLRLKGLFPILSDQSLVGIVNFEGGLNSIKRELKKQDIDYLYFIADSKLRYVTNFDSQEKIDGYQLSQIDLDQDFLHDVQELFTNREDYPQILRSKKYLYSIQVASNLDNEINGLHILGMKTNIVLASYREQFMHLFELLVIIIMMMVLTAFLVGATIKRIIINPVLKLKDATQSMDIGDLKLDIEKGRNDEIGMLYRSFLEMMKKVEKYSNNLEKLITKKTEQYIKAKESDRLKSAFLANMSHEIRTPMNGILGFANLLKKPNLPESKHDEYIQVIEASSHRMLDILNNIIDISKIEAGICEITEDKISIREMLQYHQKFFQPEAEAKGLKLACLNSMEESDFYIVADSEKVYAIITNLIKNAIKYTEQGYIWFGYRHKEDFLEFFVQDTGFGIKKHRLNAVFDRFVQEGGEVQHAGQGAGLGLAICKAYVEFMNGEIWVESEYGKGSVFYFRLPLRLEPIKKEVHIKKSDSEQRQETSKEGLNILVVEDDPTSALLLEEIIADLAHEVYMVKNGREAVDICKQNRQIDLILMDIRMPGMDGYETSMQIRQFNKDVFIIAQTAHAMQGDEERAREVGCNAYITKPIEREELLELIMDLVNV